MLHVTAKGISQKGTCAAGHRMGDEFVIIDKTPLGMCSWAFYTLFPFAEVLQFGGSFSWEEDPDKTTVACPNLGNPVVIVSFTFMQCCPMIDSTSSRSAVVIRAAQ